LFMVITGEFIRRLRLEAGLTQQELARLAGVSQAHIAKIESGKVDPRLSTINRILRVLTEGRGIPCHRLMTPNVISVSPDDTVEEACKLMVKHAISQLPVMKDGRVVGTITEKAIVRHLSPDLAKQSVKAVMEQPLPTISKNASIETVALLLEDNPGVLITDGGEIVGIITRSDLLRIIIEGTKMAITKKM